MLTHRRFDRSTVIFVGLIVLSFILTTLDVRAEGDGFGDTLRSAAQTGFSPVQRAATAVTRPVVGFFDSITNLATLRDENDRLQTEVALLEDQIAETEQIRSRLRELEAINDLVVPGEIDTVTARVIAVGVSDFDHIRRIDRGTDDGITEGMAVIDERGLVGRIVAPVTSRTATVRLITDPLSTVGVTVLSTGEAGWVTGRGDGPLVLKMARASRDITAGDLLVTGGGRFPPDQIVGTVREGARSDAGFLLTTEVDPRVDFARIDFVKVLISTQGDEPVVDIDTEDRLPVEEEGAPGTGEDAETGGSTTP